MRGVTSLMLLNNMLWSSSRDTTIRVWDLVRIYIQWTRGVHGTEDKLS